MSALKDTDTSLSHRQIVNNIRNQLKNAPKLKVTENPVFKNRPNQIYKPKSEHCV